MAAYIFIIDPSVLVKR